MTIQLNPNSPIKLRIKFTTLCVCVQMKIYSTCRIVRENICSQRERKSEREHYGAWFVTCVLTADLSLQTRRADLGAETHTEHSEMATESEKL